MSNQRKSKTLAHGAVLMVVCGLLSGGWSAIGQASILKKLAGGVNRDYQEAMKPSANVLRRISPKPRWSSTVLQPDISEIYELENNTLLTGFRDLQAAEGFYQIQMSVNGPYVAFDMHSGREKWRFDTKSEEEMEYSAIPAEGIVFIREKASEGVVYHALNAETGKERWSRKVGIIHGFNVSVEAGTAVFAEYQPNNALVAIDMTSGREKWRVNDAFKGEYGLPTIKLRGNELHVVDDEHVSLWDLVNGGLKWKSEELGKVADSSFPVWLKDATLVPTSGGKMVKVGSNGESIWSVTLGGEPGVLSLTEQSLYVQVITSSETNEWDLLCLSLDSGKEKWRRPVSGGELNSDFQISGETLVFTTTASLEIWNGASGKAIRNINLTEHDKAAGLSNRDIDSIRIYPENVVVANERWVGAYSLKSGKRAWFYKSNLAFKYTLSEALGDREHAIKMWLLMAGVPEETRNQTMQVITSQNQLNYKSPTSHAQRNLDAVMAGTEYTLNSEYSYQLERQAAHGQRANAISGSIAEAETRMATSRMMTNIEGQLLAWDNILAAVDAQKQVKARAQIITYKQAMNQGNARVPIAKNAQFLSLQQDWYVRPFEWPDGQGVLLVNMKTGQWRELITSPDEGEIKDRFIGIPLSLISRDGKMLVTHGIGLDTENWQSDDRFLTRRTVHRSVQGFELDKVRWREIEQYPKYSVAR